MPGGLAGRAVTQEDIDLVNQNLAGINTKLGTSHTAFKVDSAHTQVVAGTNYFYHLTSEDHKKYSVVIFVPLPFTGNPPQVTLAEPDHTQPRNPHS